MFSWCTFVGSRLSGGHRRTLPTQEQRVDSHFEQGGNKTVTLCTKVENTEVYRHSCGDHKCCARPKYRNSSLDQGYHSQGKISGK